MSGILGQSVPSDNTVLYKAPIDKLASCSLIANNNNASSADTYDVAVRDYDRVVTLSSNTANTGNFNNVVGKILSDSVITLTTSSGNLDTDVAADDTVTFLLNGTSTPTGITAKVAKVFEAYTTNSFTLDQRSVDKITVSTFAAGAIEIDDQLADANGDNGTVKGISDPGGSADITLVLEMTSGNFTAAESLDNSTKGTSAVATVAAVTVTAAPALFDNTTNQLFEGFTTGDGNLLVIDISDSSITNGFDIYTDPSLIGDNLDTTSVLRVGAAGSDGKMYLGIDSSTSDTYYFGASAYTGNISNVLSTTGSSSFTGTNNALLLYDVQGGSLPTTNNDLSLSGNTFTISNVTGSSISAKTIGKFSDPVLKVLEFDSLNTVSSDTLLYNNSNQDFALATVTSVVSNESYIFKANALAAASSEKFSGIILGPEQSVLVNSASTTDIAFTLLGFEEAL